MSDLTPGILDVSVRISSSDKDQEITIPEAFDEIYKSSSVGFRILLRTENNDAAYLNNSDHRNISHNVEAHQSVILQYVSRV